MAAIDGQAVATDLKRRIVAGDWAPGGQLPSRDEFAAEFGVTRDEIDKVLSVMHREGYIDIKGGRGDFVAEHPPHLAHYAMVFAMERTDPGWSRLCTALVNEARRFEPMGPRRIRFYQGVAPSQKDQAARNRKLLDAIKNQHLAGVIFAGSPTAMIDLPELRQAKLPHIAIMPETQAPEGIRVIELDEESLINRALDYLQERGRTRIAVFPRSMKQESRVVAALKQRELKTRKQWLLGVNSRHKRWTRNTAHLLMDLPPDRRPDGLLVLDDDVVEPLTEGIAASNVVPERDVDLVAVTHFPWPTRSHVPARRVGYDIRHLVQLCIKTLDDARNSSPPPDVQQLAAVYDTELKGPSSADPSPLDLEVPEDATLSGILRLATTE